MHSTPPRGELVTRPREVAGRRGRPGERWRIGAALGTAFVIALLAVFAGAGTPKSLESNKPTRLQVVSALYAPARVLVNPAPLVRTWTHPLFGTDRRLPETYSRRFGAFRAHAHPKECREGHCGIDLAARIGEPVIAVTDGRVERVADDDPTRLGGVYIRIVHTVAAGAIVTWYMHLLRPRKGLQAGDFVSPGQIIGYAGKSGIESSEPHLHFAVGLRFPDREADLFVDPEPLLRKWRMQPVPATATASARQ